MFCHNRSSCPSSETSFSHISGWKTSAGRWLVVTPASGCGLKLLIHQGLSGRLEILCSSTSTDKVMTLNLWAVSPHKRRERQIEVKTKILLRYQKTNPLCQFANQTGTNSFPPRFFMFFSISLFILVWKHSVPLVYNNNHYLH